MTTPRIRSRVSFAVRTAALTLSLAAGACARNPSPATSGSTAAVPERLRAVRFDNEAPSPVDVYLIGERREWRLGRIAPGARATLHLPEAALAAASGFVRLAAVPSGAPTLLAARDPRASITIAQPAASIVSQRWAFSQRQLAAPMLLGARP